MGDFSQDFMLTSQPEPPLTSNTGYHIMSPYIDLGLPGSIDSSMPLPGLETTSAAISPAPPITTAQSIWDTIKNDSYSAMGAVETGVKNVYGGIKDITKTVYQDVSSGVGTVYDDVAAPVEKAATSTYWYLILGVIVIGGVLYFAGKSGALKISV